MKRSLGRTLVFVPAAGKGSRLMPLTKRQAKPALPICIISSTSYSRMIDSTIRILPDCPHIVSISYNKNSLLYLKEVDNVLLFEPEDPWIDTSIVECLLGCSYNQYDYFLYIPPDAAIDSDIIEKMYECFEEDTVAALLCSTNCRGHNLRYADAQGNLSREQTHNVYGDLGIYLAKWNPFLKRIKNDKQIDILRGWEKSKDCCKIKIVIPAEDIPSVDIGTPQSFYDYIYKKNKNFIDENHNIVFPGAKINNNSSFTIALPNSDSCAVILERCVVPEGAIIINQNDVLCLTDIK